MLTTSTVFFNVLEDRHCYICNAVLPEMADCYANVCDQCAGTVYYPLNLTTLKAVATVQKVVSK